MYNSRNRTNFDQRDSALTMSTGLTLDALKAKADALTEEVRAQDDNLTMMYAVHHHGQLQSTLHIMEDIILQHPAGLIAKSIVNRAVPPLEPSSFMGLAAAQSRSWLGLQTTTSMLAIISVNVDQFDDFDEALYELYHQTWHGLEIAEVCRRPEMMERLQSRPMVPKRNPMSEAKANMRGDIFTALMLSAEGYDDAVERLARHRAHQVLERIAQAKPENFPFVLGAEACDFAYREIYGTLDPELSRIERCRFITSEISDATTDDQIRQWWRFCEPAQDMAWRGYDPSIILGAALHTSEDPYVRAIAHQMIGVTGINPSHLEKLRGEYNPFLKLERNAAAHYALIDEKFQMVLSQGLEDDSGKPFLAAANTQNRDLVQGRFLGWCASALQASGKAFERARAMGKSPDQAAKLEFEIHRSGPPMENLQAMCKDIIRKQREGGIVTLDQIPEMAKTVGELSILIESVEQTITDPGYQHTIEAVQELTRTLEPDGPMPHHSQQLAPQMVVAPTAHRVTPQVLEFSPDGLSLPPMTTRSMPGQSRAAPPPAKPAAMNKVFANVNNGELPLELAFAETEDKNKPPASETTGK